MHAPIIAGRRYCRNPRCRMKLPAPVENEHHAFCCTGCYMSFYRSHCLVCQEPLRRKNERQRFGSGHRVCQSEYRTFPHVYDYPSREGHHPTAVVRRPLESAHFTGLETCPKADRPWRQIAGPELSARSFALATLPLDLATADRLRRANAKAREGVAPALVGAGDVPINLVGNAQFPTTATLDPELSRTITQMEIGADPPGLIEAEIAPEAAS